MFNGTMITYTLGLLLTLTPPVVNDDRDVIQTALLSFFRHEEWHSGDWKPKSHVVLRTQFRSKLRPDFNAELELIRENCQRELEYATESPKKDEKLTPKEVARLKEYAEDSRRELSALAAVKSNLSIGTDYMPSAIAPLKSMTWDSRIILSDKWNRRFRETNENDKSLEQRTVYASASRPAYSPNGRYSIVFFSIPWSIHSADIRFLLERKAGVWVQILVSKLFYV